MKIMLLCRHCLNSEKDPAKCLHYVGVNDTGIYELECPDGHHSRTIMQQLKFELLFQLAINALTDGYQREAVTTFAATLERFYEFCLQVHARHNAIEHVFEDAWRGVANQSERQLGAFIFVSTMIFGRAPKLLSSKETAFRNSVVHKGAIPTYDQAIEFGTAVGQLVRAEIADMQAAGLRATIDAVRQQCLADRHAAAQKLPPAPRTWSHSHPGTCDLFGEAPIDLAFDVTVVRGQNRVMRAFGIGT